MAGICASTIGLREAHPVLQVVFESEQRGLIVSVDDKGTQARCACLEHLVDGSEQRFGVVRFVKETDGIAVSESSLHFAVESAGVDNHLHCRKSLAQPARQG